MFSTYICVSLIFSDGFDVDNALASHAANSLTGAYVFPLNLEPHHRSKTSSFLATQVVFDRDIKRVGFNVCYKRLVDDINNLVSEGLQCSLGEKPYPVRFICWCADNLERHKV